MDEEKLKRIQAFLAERNASIDTLPKAKVSQLEKIDEAIQNRLTEVIKAQETLKTCSVNVSTIATDTDISRKTFYNNELLKLYVESYSTVDDSDEKMVKASELINLKEKNEILNQEIRGFVLRDIDIENVKHENSKLTEEIINLRTRVDSLESEYERSQKELSEAKAKLYT